MQTDAQIKIRFAWRVYKQRKRIKERKKAERAAAKKGKKGVTSKGKKGLKSAAKTVAAVSTMKKEASAAAKIEK